MIKPVIRFYPYQQRWLKDDSRFKIGMFSRQTGKTFTTCGELVDDCIQGEIEGRKARWVILSRGERQAAEAMEEAIKPITKAFYGAYNTVVERWRAGILDTRIPRTPSQGGGCRL